MDKVPFSNLNLTLKEDVKTIKVNDIEIEVKQYLPVEKQVDIIANVLRNSADDNNFANPTKVEVFFNLELVYAYTNLEFTLQQREAPTVLYDILESNGVLELIINAIPQMQYNCLLDNMTETIDNYYKQRNSALGILEQISTDYKGLDFDAKALQEKLTNNENFDIVKEVVEKLG